MEPRTVEIVSDAFIVIVGVAVERFLTEYPLGHNDPAFQRPVPSPADPNKTEIVKDGWYWLCYTLALMVLVTLVLRFLVGGNSDFGQTYVTGGTPEIKIREFITDVCFLMFFGAFLVGAALSESVRAFMGWLSLSSAAGVVWSVTAHAIRQKPYIGPWCLHVAFMVVFAGFLIGVALSDSVHSLTWWLTSTFVVGVAWSVVISRSLRPQNVEFSKLSVKALICLLSLGLLRICLFRNDRHRSSDKLAGWNRLLMPVLFSTAYVVTCYLTVSGAFGVISRTIVSGATGEHEMIFWWLAINSVQFAISSILYLFCYSVGRRPRNGRIAVRWVLAAAAAWYVFFIFFFDLQTILNYNNMRHIMAPAQ